MTEHRCKILSWNYKNTKFCRSLLKRLVKFYIVLIIRSCVAEFNLNLNVIF